MLAVPNLHIKECTETKGPLHPLLVLGCIPSSSHLHLFFFPMPTAITSTCTVFCSHWGYTGHVLSAQFQFHLALSHTRISHCTVHVGVPTTYKVFTTVSFLLDHPFPVPGPSSHFQCQEQPINPQMYCNGTISSKDFTTRCYTDTECNSYTQMSPIMTIHHFLVIPSSKSPLLVRLAHEPTLGRRCARDLRCNRLTTLHAPHWYVCWVPIASIITAIDFGCRSHAEIACRAIAIATSHICDWSQHVRAA